MSVERHGTYQAAFRMWRVGWRFSNRTALTLGGTNARSIDGDDDGFLYEGGAHVYGQFWTHERTWVEFGGGMSRTQEVRDDVERMIVGEIGLSTVAAGGLVIGTAGPLSIDLRLVAHAAIHSFGRAEQVGMLLGVSWN